VLRSPNCSRRRQQQQQQQQHRVCKCRCTRSVAAHLAVCVQGEVCRALYCCLGWELASRFPEAVLGKKQAAVLWETATSPFLPWRFDMYR
jgi:hypothetical protein